MMNLPKKLDFDLLLLNIDFYNSIYKTNPIQFIYKKNKFFYNLYLENGLLFFF